MGITHFAKVSGIDGVYIGNKDNEVIVADESGILYNAGNRVIPAGENIVKTVKLEVAYNTSGLSTGVTVKVLPAGSIVLGAYFRTTTAWDSETSAAVSLGYGASLNEFISGQSVKSAGLASGVSGAVPTAPLASETTVKVKVVTSGTTTAGAGLAILMYV